MSNSDFITDLQHCHMIPMSQTHKQKSTPKILGVGERKTSKEVLKANFYVLLTHQLFPFPFSLAAFYYIATTSSASLEAECGHVTQCWPMRSKWKCEPLTCLIIFSERKKGRKREWKKIEKKKENILPFILCLFIYIFLCSPSIFWKE